MQVMLVETGQSALYRASGHMLERAIDAHSHKSFCVLAFRKLARYRVCKLSNALVTSDTVEYTGYAHATRHALHSRKHVLYAAE